MRCGGISPRIAQGFETGALLGDRAQQVEEIAGRACQPVKPGDNKYIAFNEYAPIRRANCLRSDRAPLIFSWKILVHFWLSVPPNCAARDCPSVLTRAYP